MVKRRGVKNGTGRRWSYVSFVFGDDGLFHVSIEVAEDEGG